MIQAEKTNPYILFISKTLVKNDILEDKILQSRLEKNNMEFCQVAEYNVKGNVKHIRYIECIQSTYWQIIRF